MSHTSRSTQAIALTIAGSDPSGGAGLQADLKVFHQFGVYGMSVVTLLTVQNTTRVSKVQAVDGEILDQQLDAVLEDIPPHAAKTGALGSADIVQRVAAAASRFSFPLVVDPAAVSTQGARLITEEAIALLRDELLPKSFLVTPNLAEAELLCGREVKSIDEMKIAAEMLCRMGARNTLIKGGHLNDNAVDLLLEEDGTLSELMGTRIETAHTHGTGCCLSAAITAGLASGLALREATTRAKNFITEAIRTAPHLGHGNGPINLFTSTERKKN